MYSGIDAKVNLINDFFDSGLSEEKIILQALINGISSIFQKNIEFKLIIIKEQRTFKSPLLFY